MSTTCSVPPGPGAFRPGLGPGAGHPRARGKLPRQAHARAAAARGKGLTELRSDRIIILTGTNQ